MARTGALASVALAVALLVAAPAMASGVVVDPHAEVAAALFAASATQAAAEKAADAKIVAQRAQIVALAAKVKAGQAKQAELTAAEDGFVAQLAAKDRAYAEAIDAFRGAVTHITDTPEGVAALKKFNDGDEAGAIKIIGQLDDARDAALQKATDIQKAVGRRDQAQLALDAHYRDKVDAATVIGLFEQVVRLDPGVYNDWVQLGRLYMAAGRLTDARRATEAAVKTASADADRAIALDALADVRAAQGDLGGAREATAQLLAILQALATASPDDFPIHRDYAIALQKAALRLKANAKLAAAADGLRQSMVVSLAFQKSHTLTPLEVGATETTLITDLINMGQVLAELGQLPAARQAYDTALVGAREMVGLNPENAIIRDELAAALDWRGELSAAQGDLAGARADYQEEIDIQRRAAAADPGDVSRSLSLAGGLIRLGGLDRRQGDLSGALKLYQEALALSQVGAAADAGNSRAQHTMAAALVDEGEIYSFQNDLPRAKSAMMQSIEILARLSAADPTDAQDYADLARATVSLGDALERGGDHAKAHAAYAESLTIDRELVAKSSLDRSYQSALATVLVDDGEALSALGDMVGAIKDEAEALPILRQRVAGDATDADAQRLLAVALTDLATAGGAGVTWADAASQWQTIEQKGLLQRDDRRFLTDAVQHAGAAKSP
jgi:tetratricopeptide (TPR) repeat protein